MSLRKGFGRHYVEASILTGGPVCRRHPRWSYTGTRLKVCIVSISVVIISVGEPGVLLAVRDPSEGRVVVETRDEDLVHYFLRLLSADFPHRQDGAKRPASDALLTPREKHNLSVGLQTHKEPKQMPLKVARKTVPDDAASSRSWIGQIRSKRSSHH